MLGISWVPAQLAASQEGLSSVELVNKFDMLTDMACSGSLLEPQSNIVSQDNVEVKKRK
jgi:hypothetical protein